MSIVNSAVSTGVVARAMPPWRRSANAAGMKHTSALVPVPAFKRESDDEISTAAARTSLPWRRGANNGGIERASVPTPAFPLKHEPDDDISTTTGCSDAEDTASTLSRSSSGCELSCVISREAMLLHRARCLPMIRAANGPQGLQCREVARSPASKPVKAPPSVPAGFAPPPGLDLLSGAALSVPEYSPPVFRKELMTILKDLALDRNVARAVRRVRAQAVPSQRQGAEYADTITFILEESRGAARRSFVALVAGLAYGVFDKTQCIAGLTIFFEDIYPDLLLEVPKLNKLVTVELLPTLSSVFSSEELSPFAAIAQA